MELVHSLFRLEFPFKIEFGVKSDLQYKLQVKMGKFLTVILLFDNARGINTKFNCSYSPTEEILLYTWLYT